MIRLNLNCAGVMPDLGWANFIRSVQALSSSEPPVLAATSQYALPGGRSGMALARRVAMNKAGSSKT